MALATGLTVSSSAQERPRIGLALSGGGARGFAHAGVLKVLGGARRPHRLHCRDQHGRHRRGTVRGWLLRRGSGGPGPDRRLAGRLSRRRALQRAQLPPQAAEPEVPLRAGAQERPGPAAQRPDLGTEAERHPAVAEPPRRRGLRLRRSGDPVSRGGHRSGQRGSGGVGRGVAGRGASGQHGDSGRPDPGGARREAPGGRRMRNPKPRSSDCLPTESCWTFPSSPRDPGAVR